MPARDQRLIFEIRSFINTLANFRYINLIIYGQLKKLSIPFFPPFIISTFLTKLIKSGFWFRSIAYRLIDYFARTEIHVGGENVLYPKRFRTAAFSSVMIRRKLRPIGIFACVLVFLLFRYLRRGEREVFTFDSLPPYTDTDEYVKKPKPPPIPWKEPPPPPPDWGKRPFYEGSREQQQQQPPPKPDARLPPHAQDPPPDESTHRIPEKFPVKGNPTNGKDPKFPLNQSSQSGRSGRPPTIPDQPPVPGDLEVDGQPIFNRPLYTSEELAPRIDKYPIAPKDVIKLPKLKPFNFPKVQASFHSETAEQRRIRSQRQAAIKRAMTRSWEAYSTYAMGHDEVRPVSGRYKDPFCGWGATLIDSLDTLQIMGMNSEYQLALKYVANIDFAHTPSYSVPLFETVIRYLGGLLGAYDVSNGRDGILLEKAKDLGDMLMGAFDTINRMPLLRYNWRPQAARQNLRASENSCLAELGTLTLEFTRLAQITGNHSYYDAVIVFLKK